MNYAHLHAHHIALKRLSRRGLNRAISYLNMQNINGKRQAERLDLNPDSKKGDRVLLLVPSSVETLRLAPAIFLIRGCGRNC